MPYRRYADFSRRSQRKEYWMFMLLMAVIAVALGGLVALGLGYDDGSGAQQSPILAKSAAILSGVWVLASIVPFIAVHVRRFHDLDKPGWLFLLSVIPGGYLIVLIFMALKGTQGANRFGTDSMLALQR